MFLIVIALLSSLIFPYAFINAVTNKKNRKIFTIISCISFFLVIGVILFILKFMIDNYLS